MTLQEISAKAAADSIARIKEADDYAALSSEAFAFGLGDKYLQGRVNDINRRINERFGVTGSGASSIATADPADLGKPSP